MHWIAVILLFLLMWFLAGAVAAADLFVVVTSEWRGVFASWRAFGAALVLTLVFGVLGILWGIVLRFLWQDVAVAYRWARADPGFWRQIGMMAVVAAFLLGRASTRSRRSRR